MPSLVVCLDAIWYIFLKLARSKSSKRGAPHKHIRLRDISRVMLGLPTRGDFKPYDSANCWSFEINNQIIDFMVGDTILMRCDQL